MADYNGYVEVIGELRPKNGANFKVIDAENVSVGGVKSGVSIKDLLGEVVSVYDPTNPDSSTPKFKNLAAYIDYKISQTSFGDNELVAKIVKMLGLDENSGEDDTPIEDPENPNPSSIFGYVDRKVQEEKEAREAQIQAIFGDSAMTDIIAQYLVDNDYAKKVESYNYTDTKISQLNNLSMADVDAQITDKLVPYITFTQANQLAQDKVNIQKQACDLANAGLASRINVVESKLAGVTGVVVIAENMDEMVDQSVIYWNKQDNMWYYYNTESQSFIAGGQIGGVEMDITLTKSGYAADSKATGDRCDSIELTIQTLSSTVNGMKAKTDYLTVHSSIYQGQYMQVETDNEGHLLSAYDLYGNKKYFKDVYANNINEMYETIRKLNLRISVLEESIGNSYSLPKSMQ